MDFVRPQRVFKNEAGEDEVINVSVAQHPQIMFGDSVLYGETANRGRAFHNGANDKSEGAIYRGYNFGEQFDRAVETDPPVVLVTGWNEWIAGRWQGTPERPIRFVDLCNCEYSRDLEMMRGGCSAVMKAGEVTVDFGNDAFPIALDAEHFYGIETVIEVTQEVLDSVLYQLLQKSVSTAVLPAPDSGCDCVYYFEMRPSTKKHIDELLSYCFGDSDPNDPVHHDGISDRQRYVRQAILSASLCLEITADDRR